MSEKYTPELIKIVKGTIEMIGNCNVESGVCCCGESMDNHPNDMDCGHSPVDSGAYNAKHLYEQAVEVLAKATGEQQ